MRIKIRIFNIEWVENSNMLPTELTINWEAEETPCDSRYVDAERIAETLSEKYGACVYSFECEELETVGEEEQDVDEVEYADEAEQYVDEVEYADEAEQYVDEVEYADEAEQYVDEVEYADDTFVPDDVLEMAMYMEGDDREDGRNFEHLSKEQQALAYAIRKDAQIRVDWDMAYDPYESTYVKRLRQRGAKFNMRTVDWMVKQVVKYLKEVSNDYIYLQELIADEYDDDCCHLVVTDPDSYREYPYVKGRYTTNNDNITIDDEAVRLMQRHEYRYVS